MSRSIHTDYEALRATQARAQESIVTAPEACLPCADPKATVDGADDIALCSWHWNAWLARYLGADDQPCAAHLILEAS